MGQSNHYLFSKQSFIGLQPGPLMYIFAYHNSKVERQRRYGLQSQKYLLALQARKELSLGPMFLFILILDKNKQKYFSINVI